MTKEAHRTGTCNRIYNRKGKNHAGKTIQLKDRISCHAETGDFVSYRRQLKSVFRSGRKDSYHCIRRRIRIVSRRNSGSEPRRLFRLSCIDSSAIMLQIEYQHMRELYATLFYEYLQNHHDVSRSLNSTLMQLLQYLTEHFGEAGDGNGVDPKTEYVIRYIDSHWNEEISLSSLASEVHFSSSYLSRFFQKTTGMNFSSYLRKVRMIHARQMLAQEDISITQIAYDCGFRNASVFIETFKQEYQMTPGQFRQIHPVSGQMHAGVLSVHDQRSDLSVLLVHMPEKDTSKVTLRKELLEIDCRNREKEDHSWTRMLNIGYAREGLLSDVREQIKRAQKEIGFRYFRCHGLLDDDMYIYGETAEGKPIFSFSYVDLLFDFVTGLGMTPFVELSFMPSILAKEQTRIFDRPSVISGCSDLEKWKLLVRALLQHLADRYGIHAQDMALRDHQPQLCADRLPDTGRLRGTLSVYVADR